VSGITLYVVLLTLQVLMAVLREDQNMEPKGQRSNIKGIRL